MGDHQIDRVETRAARHTHRSNATRILVSDRKRSNTGKLVRQAMQPYERNTGNEIVEIACAQGSLRRARDHPVFVQGRGYARADSVKEGEFVVWAGGCFPLPELQQ